MLTNDFTVSFNTQDMASVCSSFLSAWRTFGPQPLLAADANVAWSSACLHSGRPSRCLTDRPVWYQSSWRNPNQDKSDDFVSLMRKTILLSTIRNLLLPANCALAMPGTFENNTPIFDPKMDLTDYSTWINYHIRLYVATYEAALRDDYFYILDPISDPNNPGVKRDNVMVYALFDKTAPK